MRSKPLRLHDDNIKVRSLVRVMFVGLPGCSHPLVAPAAGALAALAAKETVQGRKESKGDGRSCQKESTKVSSKLALPAKPGASGPAEEKQGAAPVPREWVRLLLSACGGGGGGGGSESDGGNLAAAVDALTKIAMESEEEEEEEEEEGEQGEDEEEEGQARAGVPVKEEEVRK